MLHQPATGITAYLENGGTLEAAGYRCHPRVVVLGLVEHVV